MRIEEHPDSIVLQFGVERGEVAGQLRGAHLSTRRFLLNEDGTIGDRINRGPDDNAREFPREEIAKYLGTRFDQFLQQLAGAQAMIDSLQDKMQERDAQIGRLTAQLAEARSASPTGQDEAATARGR